MADELPSDPVEGAREFLRKASDAESENRVLGLQALQFRYGDQWPQYAIASRGLERPQLTINETNSMIKRICNMQRQQRPRGKASPVDDVADPKVAKIITGLGRHVEVNSDADYAYDCAFDFAATIGWGYIRLRTDYIAEDSFDQSIYIDAVRNPFAVYYDWNSVLPDGSDAERALMTELIGKEAFKKKYPDAQDAGQFSARGTGDSDPDWVTTTAMRVAEYYYVERVRDTLVKLTDGTVLFASEMKKIQRLLAMANIGVAGDRPSFRRAVKWSKVTAFEELEKKEIPGKWIPIVPVYWTDVTIDSRRVIQGLVHDAIDPARMNNFWLTAMTESLALAPKAKWLIAEGQDEGHENEFKNANLAPSPTLHYKPTGVDGKELPPPQRIAPEPPPAGLIQAAMMASQSLSKVLGVVDPATRQGAQHKGEGTLLAERAQFENSNFDGYDNLTRSIKQVWRIMLSWVPTTFDTQRVQRIIGDDGKEKMVTLNERAQGEDEQGQAIERVLNDVCVGTYDVVMETGPGYDTKRQEGVRGMVELMATPLGEKVAQAADDLIVRSMDFPGADLIADRLAAANPLSQIDEMADTPPAIQMKLKSQEAMIQELRGALQAAEIEKTARSATAAINAEAKVLTARIQAEGDKEEREVTARASVQQAETHALTAQNVAEINALARILTSNSEQAHDLRKMLATFGHEAKMMDKQAANAKKEEPADAA